MATPTLAQQAAIANLYIALFNRAPDAAGFAFWTQALADGASIDVLARGFVQTPEAQAIYPVSQTATQFVTTYYANVLGRPIDASGLKFWTDVLESTGGVDSTFARALVVSKIVEVVNTPLPVKPAELTDAAYALTFADRNAFKNKGEIAIFYATEYKGTDLNLAKQVLSVVGPASTTIDVAKALLNPPTGGGGEAPVTPPVVVPPVVVGPQNFVGKRGADNFVGGVSDDTFTFVIDNNTQGITTLGKDTLTGGAGNDTMTVTTTGIVTETDFADATISGIETLVLDRTGVSPVTLTAWEGLTTIVAKGGSGEVWGLGLADGAKATLDGVAAGSALLISYKAGATTGAAELKGGVSADFVRFNAPTGGLDSFTFTSSGSANSATNLLMGTVKTMKIVADADFSLTKLLGGGGVQGSVNVEVSGQAAVNLGTLNGIASVKAIDASANSGGLKATLDKSNSWVNIKGSSVNDVISTSDTVLSTLLTMVGAVDAGDGTGDRLIVNSTVALNSADLGARYTNFEILRVENGVTVDLDHIGGIRSVEINDGTGATGVRNLSVDQAAAVIIMKADGSGPLSIGVKGATNNNQVDTVKASITTRADGSAPQVNLIGLTLAGVEKLELTGNGLGFSNDGFLSLDTANATSLESIVVKNIGRAFITVSSGHTAQNLSIDASGASGSITVDAAAFSSGAGLLTVRGGNAADTLTIAQKATVWGGLGADTFVLKTGGLALATASQAGVDAKLMSINDIALGDSIRFDFGQHGGTFTGQVGVQSNLDGADVYTQAGQALFTAARSYAAFSYQGDTYVVADINNNHAYDQGDVIVKLAGMNNWFGLEMQVNAQDVLSVVTAQFG